MKSDGDPISDVLDHVRLNGATLFVWEPSWPFRYDIPSDDRLGSYLLPDAERIISYHIVTEGPCWGGVPGEDPVHLETGDIFVVPRGDAYVMSNEPLLYDPEHTTGAEHVLRQIRDGEFGNVIRDGGGGEESNRIICGFLGCDLSPYNPLIESLPRLIRVPRLDDGRTDHLSNLIDFALQEAFAPGDGGRSVLLRLSEAMLIAVLRRYVTSSEPIPTGWLAGLREPIVSKALALIHGRPRERWTLANLARAVGSSRSTLAERFARLVGQPPMQYLTLWRMQLAARQLTNEGVKLFAVAQEVGYESEAAFSRAFKRVVGIPPTEWRETRSPFGPAPSA
ncbi:MAG: AraC family transcriptional regulator [Deltaproteobacteria bacterium]|jgi:AraC-like DNA-binding protein